MHTKPLLFIAPIDLLGEGNEKFELKKQWLLSLIT